MLMNCCRCGRQRKRKSRKLSWHRTRGTSHSGGIWKRADRVKCHSDQNNTSLTTHVLSCKIINVSVSAASVYYVLHIFIIFILSHLIVHDSFILSSQAQNVLDRQILSIVKVLNGFLITRRQMNLKDMCGYIMLESFFSHICRTLS